MSPPDGYYDAETGTYYQLSRYRDEDRFLSRDTIVPGAGETLNANLYIYANGNPGYYNDPTGMFTLTDVSAGTGLAIALGGILATAFLSHQLAKPAAGQAVSGALDSAIDLISSGADELQELGTRLMQNISGYAKEVQKALTAAAAAGVVLNSSLKPYPVSKTSTPAIFANTVTALAARPSWFVLTYAGPAPALATTKRTAALAGRGRAGPGLSWDEFPYASTLEGGFGSFVAAVPRLENFIQGGTLGAFYRIIMKSTPGKFLVVPVP